MEANLQPQALIPGAAAGAAADLEQPLHSVAQALQTQEVQEANQQQVAFAAAVENQMQELAEILENGEKASPTSKEDDPNGKAPAEPTASPQWPSRVNWGADMTKLLVSAAAYVLADMADPELGSRVRRIGKWSLVSSAMAERGFPASPQQCADKFHDINKRYRRVTELLGYGTACRIIEKPALLEKLKMPEKLKDEVRKQLSSKNLHYEEMCSYHNRNKLCLLDDPSLQRMLRRFARGSTVGNGEDDDDPMSISDDKGEGEESSDDMEVSAEERRHQGVLRATKKLKHGHEEGSSQDVVAATDRKIIQVQRERLKIRRETLEMRQSHLEWMKSRKEEDKELRKMRLDIELMELENDKLERELEQKIKELEKMGIKPTKRI